MIPRGYIANQFDFFHLIRQKSDYLFPFNLGPKRTLSTSDFNKDFPLCN
jgi:hypothetical protein